MRGLPSDQTSPAVGGTLSGVTDVTFIGLTFIGHRLYALLGRGGCSHSNPGTVNAVLGAQATARGRAQPRRAGAHRPTHPPVSRMVDIPIVTG